MFCAKGNPPLNWGNPYNLSRLWARFSLSQYPSVLTKNPRNAGVILRQMGVLIDIGLNEFSPALCALLVAGAAGLWRITTRRKFFFLSGVAAMGSIGATLLINPVLERETLHALDVFLLYAWVAFAIVIGAVAESLRRHLGGAFQTRQLPAQTPSWALAVVLTTVLAFWNFSSASMRGNFLAYDYARNMLRTMAPGAILFPGGDHNTFPLLYCTIVEKRRADVTVADKYGYIEKSVYKDMSGDFPEIPTREQRMQILSWIIDNTTRPIYFSTPPNLPGLKLRQEGLLFRVVAEGEADSNQEEVWRRYRWTNIKDDNLTLAISDYSTDMIMSDYAAMRAQFLLESGRRKEGERMLAEAARLGWGVKELLNNLGSLAAEQNLIGLAKDLFRQAIDVDPSYQTPWRNLDVLRTRDTKRKTAALAPPGLPGPIQPPDPMALLAPYLPSSPQPQLPGVGPQHEDPLP